MQITPTEITKNNKIFAHYIPKNYRPIGVNFITPENYSLQVGFIGHHGSHKIKDHIHNPNIKYKVDTTQEFLYLESGEIEVVIYDLDWSIVGKIIMHPGDVMLQVYGGHGFRVIKPCYLIEVKQGPFPGDQLMKFYRESNREIES